jgi:hypothetical protein
MTNSIQKVFALEKERDEGNQKQAEEYTIAMALLRQQLETAQEERRHWEEAFKQAAKAKADLQQSLEDKTRDADAAIERENIMKQRVERIERWHKSMKLRIDEFDECCRELGIMDWLSEFDRTIDADTCWGDGVLIKAVVKIKSQHQGRSTTIIP